ncbi:MAG: DUF370 domain-containing protein [Oscillospiraceae bacterium]|nr:DUF370 domain-containing protein [Oscillospiraceae bacterium]
MYLFLGQETVVSTRDIIGVFDLDKTSTSAETKRFLSASQKQGRIVDVSPGELPTSFVVCERGGVSRVYLSQISAGTLKKRITEY